MLNLKHTCWIQSTYAHLFRAIQSSGRSGIVMAVFTFPLLFACSQETSFTEEDKNRVHKEVEVFLNNYHRAIEKGGLEAEVDYLDASEDFFWVPPGYHSALSYDSVMAILNQNGPTIQSLRYEWKYLDIYPLSASVANYTGKLQNDMIDTTGNASSFMMLETGTLIKRENGWKILHGQSRILETEEIVF